MASDAVLALTTEATEAKAQRLAEALLERGLAACIALKPVQSLYRWQGRLERSNEIQLLIKTHPACLAALEQTVRELHSYDTPQWLHWPVSSSGDYAAWLNACCAIS